MTNSGTRQYEMLVRVRKFGNDRPSLFPGDSLGGHALQVVTKAVADIEAHNSSGVGTVGGGKQAKLRARRTLVGHLDAVLRCVKVIAEDVPGFGDQFELPNRRSVHTLLSAGRAFAQKAEGEKARFVALGMPADFTGALSAAVDELDHALHGIEARRDGHAAAKAGIEAALSAGLVAVRRLDVIVPNLLRQDPVTMAVWERDRQIRYFPRTRRTLARQASAPANAIGVQPAPHQPVLPQPVPAQPEQPRQTGQAEQAAQAEPSRTGSAPAAVAGQTPTTTNEPAQAGLKVAS